jgi:flagellar biogenesis protein FliO
VTQTPNQPAAPQTPDTEHDTRMTATYVQVLVLQAVILVALWVFGRMFS